MPMAACSSKPSPSSVHLLLANNADPNKGDSNNDTPLHHCGFNGATAKHMTIVKDLVAHGADLHAKDTWGKTPLDKARGNGNTATAKLLEELAAAPPAAEQHAPAHPVQ